MPFLAVTVLTDLNNTPILRRVSHSVLLLVMLAGLTGTVTWVASPIFHPLETVLTMQLRLDSRNDFASNYTFTIFNRSRWLVALGDIRWAITLQAPNPTGSTQNRGCSQPRVGQAIEDRLSECLRALLLRRFRI